MKSKIKILLKVNVRDKKSIAEAIFKTEKELGPIEVINCSNANPVKICSINLSGVFYSCQEEAKTMIIINIASMSEMLVFI